MSAVIRTHAVDDPREGRRWSGSLLLVLSVHAVAAAAILHAPAAAPPALAAAPVEAMMIELAPVPTAPPPPPEELPTGPQQVEQQPVPAPKPRPQPSEVPDPYQRETTDTEAQQETERTTAPPPTPLPPAPVAAAPQNSRAQGIDPAQATWESRLLAHLEAHQRYPSRARSNRQQGVAYLRLRIDAQGRLLAHALERSSGHPLLDAEALAAVERAQPLPPPEGDDRPPVERIVPMQFIYRR